MKKIMFLIILTLLPILITINISLRVGNPDLEYIGLHYFFERIKEFNGFAEIQNLIFEYKQFFASFPNAITSFWDLLGVAVRIFEILFMPIKFVIAALVDLFNILAWILQFFTGLYQ